MRYIDSTSIGAISSIMGGSRPPVPRGSGVYSLVFGLAGARKMSNAQRKKASRRKSRFFVDNIIMHHKRLHDKNRQITIDLVKKKSQEKEKDKKKQKEELVQKDQRKWRDKYDRNKRTLAIKERINARRIRAKSSWTALMDERRIVEGNFDNE